MAEFHFMTRYFFTLDNVAVRISFVLRSFHFGSAINITIRLLKLYIGQTHTEPQTLRLCYCQHKNRRNMKIQRTISTPAYGSISSKCLSKNQMVQKCNRATWSSDRTVFPLTPSLLVSLFAEKHAQKRTFGTRNRAVNLPFPWRGTCAAEKSIVA